MPIYTYRCEELHETDIFISYKDKQPEINCPNCNRRAKNVPALFARTPGLFGDTEGYYSSALGCYIENSVHRDRIMKEKNLVSADDYGNDRMDSALDKQRNDAQATDNYLKQYDKIYKETNCPLTAMEKASEIAPAPAHTNGDN